MVPYDVILNSPQAGEESGVARDQYNQVEDTIGRGFPSPEVVFTPHPPTSEALIAVSNSVRDEPVEPYGRTGR